MTELLYRNGVNLYDAFPGYGDIIMIVDDQFIQVIPTTPRPIDACLLLEEQFEVESEFDSLEEPHLL